jgi:multidrug transporter EmrE-like cation transporter
MSILEKVKHWSENSVVDEILIVAIVVALVETTAQNTIKTSEHGSIKFMIGMTVYMGVGYLLHYAYSKFPLGKMNTVWSCISIVLGLGIGYLAYGEKITTNTVVAAALALGAIYFSNKD